MRWRLGGQPERREELPRREGFGHRPQDPARAGAPRTGEDLDREHAAEQRGPRQPSRRPRPLGASRLGVTRGRRHDRRAPAGMPKLYTSPTPPETVGDLARAGHRGLSTSKGIYDWTRRDGAGMVAARTEELCRHLRTG